MYLDHNCPLFHSNYFRTLSSHAPQHTHIHTHPSSQLHVLFYFFSFKLLGLIIAAPNEHRCRANLWQMGNLPGTIFLKKTDFLFPRSYRLLIVPQLRMGSHELFLSPCWNVLCMYEVLYGQLYNAYITSTTTYRINVRNCHFLSRRHCFLPVFPELWNL